MVDFVGASFAMEMALILNENYNKCSDNNFGTSATECVQATDLATQFKYSDEVLFIYLLFINVCIFHLIDSLTHAQLILH